MLEQPNSYVWNKWNNYILNLHCDICILNGNAELTSCPCDCHNGKLNFD